MSGFMCGPRMYEYKGWTIEMGLGAFGVVKPSGEPYQRLPKAAREALYEFLDLPEDEQRQYRVGGGCQRIDLE